MACIIGAAAAVDTERRLARRKGRARELLGECGGAMTRDYHIEAEGTFEEAATEALVEFTIAQVRRGIDSGAITLNGSPAPRLAPARAGDIISVDVEAAEAPVIRPVAVDLPVLYEDEHLLIVDKPAGVPVLPERGSREWKFMGMLAHHAAGCGLCAGSARFRIAHRIDRDTSGAVAVAKSGEAERALSLAFAERKVEKRYLAIVSGNPAEESGTIDAPLAATKGASRAMAVRDGGKESITRWRVAERFRGYALVEARPLTGRTHQIRAHLAWAGMPLAVDETYGGSGGLLLSAFKRGYRRSGEESPLIGRLTLHCAGLAFRHPLTGAEVRVEAPLPADFERALKSLRKWAMR